MGNRPESIAALVAGTFPEEQAAEVLKLLADYGVESYEREAERVQRAIISLSEGDLDRLRHFVAAAKADYRDVLFWAENPEA